MSHATFDAAWLSLREPADHRSRARELVPTLRRAGARGTWSRVLDLGSGTGSNVRYLTARLPWATDWTVVDHDPDLLSRVVASGPDHRVRRVQGDLAAEGLEAVPGMDLVTASALLDLVSGDWLRALVDRCVDGGCGVLFALSYDGHVEWEDATSDDERVREAVNEHQESDKGLGDALGPRAAPAARALLDDAGYRTWLEPSPWVLRASRDGELMQALVAGWVDAAIEVRPSEEERIRAWADRRVRAIREGWGAVRVGHFDLLGLPADDDRSAPVDDDRSASVDDDRSASVDDRTAASSDRTAAGDRTAGGEEP